MSRKPLKVISKREAHKRINFGYKSKKKKYNAFCHFCKRHGWKTPIKNLSELYAHYRKHTTEPTIEKR